MSKRNLLTHTRSLSFARKATTVVLCYLVMACAGGPNSGGTSGGTSGGASGSSSSGVTKTAKEEPPECNVELYLPAHMPEHCKPDEKLAASKATPAQKAPDPIVGTYHVYSMDEPRESVLRLYPNGRAVLGYRNYRWRYENGEYLISWGKDYRFSMKYQRKSSFGNVRDEPELVTLDDAPIYGKFEALKVSDGPDFKFNLYKLAIVRKEPSSLACFNLGQKKYRYTEIPKELGYPSFESSSLTECEASCQPFRDAHAELTSKACPGEDPQPVAQEPDQIVGTYRMSTTRTEYPFRVYANGTAGSSGKTNYRWVRRGDVYDFFLTHTSGYVDSRPSPILKYQTIKGEPNLVNVPEVKPSRWWYGQEGLKLSSDPRYRFDLYQVQCRRGRACFEMQLDAEGKQINTSRDWTTPEGYTYTSYFRRKEPRPEWTCHNIGQRLDDKRVYWTSWGEFGNRPFHADTLSECKAICEQSLLNDFETVGEGNCANFRK